MNRAVEGLRTVSASKIKVYKTCARQYEYKYVIPFADRPADDKNVAGLLGTALHKAIELKYKEDKSPTGTFQTVMTGTLDEWENKRYKINALDYFPRAMKVGKEILTKFKWDQFTPQDLEYSFTLPFPNPENPIVNITGVIDLVDMSGLVADHKSASVAPIQDELDNDPQFIIYYWAYEQMYGVKPWKVIWNHLRTAKLIEANIEHNYELKIARLTEDINAMLNNHHYQRRQMDDTCRKKCSFYTLCYGEKAPITLDVEAVEGDE